MAKELINVIDPKVKDRANFCGRAAIIGIPTKNANKKNNVDKNNNPQNTCTIHYIHTYDVYTYTYLYTYKNQQQN